jgi:hypothetical protein
VVWSSPGTFNLNRVISKLSATLFDTTSLRLTHRFSGRLALGRFAPSVARR